jgi:sterol desaturase/sphingolipid hydroxylase (fatty acid hydroxylase superfamily)
MAVVAAIETLVPLHARRHWNRAHLGPNLALTAITFATNALLNGALVTMLSWLQSNGFGLLDRLALSPATNAAVVVLAFDLSFYVAHVAMHRIPAFWRFHRVHHCDPAVDVTTTIRQHPGEGAIRYAFLTAFAFALGASPGAFALYRLASALSGLLEHSNVRLPLWLDGMLSLVFTWPGMHKVHHSRDPRYTDTNYGNLVSWWDRLFSTFTPARYGARIAYGLDGLDDPATQTTAGLLALPFRDARPSAASPRATRAPAAGSGTIPLTRSA